ncbi:hypothetical protein GCM10010222_79310 [Streptomyces tanashiensis]|nr:hypothetical protein GCM10010222_79310 [Streptomyces tanashiensis]
MQGEGQVDDARSGTAWLPWDRRTRTPGTSTVGWDGQGFLEYDQIILRGIAQSGCGAFGSVQEGGPGLLRILLRAACQGGLRAAVRPR